MNDKVCIQLVDVSEDDRECENCAIQKIQCGNNPEYCSIGDKKKIWVFANDGVDTVDILAGKAREVLKKYMNKYFGNFTDKESFEAKILQKSLRYSEVKIRIFDIDKEDGCIMIHPETMNIEDDILFDLYEVVKKMPEGTVLSVRTYEKNVIGSKQKIQTTDFVIKRVFSI